MDGAGHSWVEAGRYHGALVVRDAERLMYPERDSFSFASELPVAEFSVGGHYGAESGQSSPCEIRDAATDISDASLLTALLVAAALSRDGYCEGELEHVVAGLVDVDCSGSAAAQQLKAGNCTALQFASM